VVKRWPVILVNIIDSVSQKNHSLWSEDPSADAKEQVEEGKAIIATVSNLKHEMSRDRPLLSVEIIHGYEPQVK